MKTWRGVKLDDRTANMMDEVARLSGPIYINPTQGSYSTSVGASGGTHAGGGAIDIMGNYTIDEVNRIVWLMRKVGFAAWHRTPQQANWPRHIHGIAVQPGGKSKRGVLSATAHKQVVDYYEGRNGLLSGAADDGPRKFVGTTWASYKKEKAALMDAYKYWYGGKAEAPQRATEKYSKLDLTKYDPQIAGLDFRLVYINVSDIVGQGVLRVRGVRADGDKTAYHDYPVQGDQLITHVYFENRGKSDGPTHFEVKTRLGLVSATLSTRYGKCAVIRK